MYLPHHLIYLFHIFFVAPLLMYAGYQGYNHCPRNYDKHLFLFLGVVGLVVLLYQSFLYYKL